jgi:transposase-like protein
MEEFDYAAFKAKALDQLKSGKPLLGKDGAFTPLLENILNAALEGEMDAHMDAEENAPRATAATVIRANKCRPSWEKSRSILPETGSPASSLNS